MANRTDWTLPEDVIYLNHGSWGPSPRVVQEAREEWSRRIDRQPMDFYLREMEPALDQALSVVAKFVGANPQDLAFVDNATVAMNAVAQTIKLQTGDEVLLTDHEYGAVFRIWRHACDRSQAKVVQARLGTVSGDPPEGEAAGANATDLVAAIFDAVTDRTKLIVVSHVTSPTATIFPVGEICQQARSRGIPVCIDGPHAIAMLPVNLRAIDCDYYCASLHKWLSAPFGSGFLYVKRSQQRNIQPPMISWGSSLGGFPQRWQDPFHWMGTRDPSPFLATPAAITCLEKVGIEAFRQTTHQLAKTARAKLEQLFEQSAWIPDSPDWYGSMIAVPLPNSDYKKPKPNATHRLQQHLRDTYRIEVPVTECRGRYLLRVSCHLYNTLDEIDYLVDSLARSRDLF